MTVFAVSMVKDEADIVAHTVTRMRDQVDHVIVADNGSTDGTSEILADLDIEVIEDADPAYYQSEKMSALAARAADAGADWVIPFDADEVWLTTSGRPLREVLAEVDRTIAPAALFNHYATSTDEGDDPISRMQWRTRDPLPLPKVAVRPRLSVAIAQGNHTASYPDGIANGLLQVRHFPYRSPEQFVSKAVNGNAAYRATDLDRGVGQHWREYGEAIESGGEEAGHRWFRDAFFFESPESEHSLVHDPCP